jgi:hypothetical protein
LKKIVKGSGGGGKSGGGEGRTPVESPDSLRSIQYAKVLDLISEGEIKGLVDGMKSIYLDETPLQNPDGSFNFSGVSMIERTGTQHQTSIPGFTASEAELAVSTEVTAAVSVTRSISNTNDTAVRVTVSVPQLTFQNLTNGDLTGTSVELAIDIQNDGGGFVPQPLRKIYQSSYLSIISGGAVSAVESTLYQIKVDWVGQNVQAPQTCSVQLQYRVVGSPTWLISQSHTFSGGSLVVAGIAGTGIITGVTTSYPSGSKTFSLTLPEAKYEFRVVKTTGSIQKASSSFFVLVPPDVGLAYGGQASITGGSVYSPAYTDVISGKTTSRYQRSYRIELPAGGPWDIRVRRITADSVQSNLNNRTFFDSLTEIIDAKLRYPHSALIGMNIDAKQFNAIPSRGYEVYGMLVKVPSNYDPLTREYDGTWDGTFQVAWSNNPAWVFYDMVTNERYGLGEFVSEDQVDKWGLYSIAQYCDVMVEDGFGGIEPRFTANLYLQSQEEAYTVIANMASIFRALAFWGSGEIRASQDSPRDAEQLFSRANVIDGRFSYSGSAANVRHSVVLVSWNDPTDAFRQKIEYIEDEDAIARYGIVQTQIVAFGCTSRGQAARVGRWLIFSEQNETETVTFRAGLDSVYVSPGSVISVQDPNRAGARLGGRLISATTNSLVLDSEILIDPGSSIKVVLPDASIEELPISNVVGETTNEISLEGAFSQEPSPYAIWMVSNSNLIPEQWRVVSVSEIDKTQFEITALNYRADKYDAVEQDLILEPLPTSSIDAGQPDTPNNLNVVESLYLAGISVIGISATVSWNTVQNAASYVLSYQIGDENPVVVENIRSNSYDIRPISEGQYTFTVFSVNTLGRRSQGNTLTLTISGKTSPPGDVSDLRVAPLGSVGLFTWNPSIDLDVIVGGRVRFRYSPDTTANWDFAFDLGGAPSGSATTTTFPLQAGIYLAKFEDGSGNQSVNATSIITDAANIIALNFVELLQGEPDWTGDKVNTQYYPDLDGLVLASEDLWDSAELMDSDEPMDFGSGISLTGTYDLGIIDLGSVKTSRINSLVQARGIDLLDFWDAEELMDSTQLVDGDIVSDVSAMIFMRSTVDDPFGTPVWTEWAQSVLSDVAARGFEFELRLASESEYHNVLVTSAIAQVDMPDLIQSGDDITSGTSTYSIVFDQEFQILPAVGVTAQDMETGDYCTITNKSTTGFDIDFFNSSNLPISRTFDYIAKAY